MVSQAALYFRRPDPVPTADALPKRSKAVAVFGFG